MQCTNPQNPCELNIAKRIESKNHAKYDSQTTKSKLFINLRLETCKFILTHTIVTTIYLSALTSEYVKAPADTNNVIINPTKIISI
jgi:hypothetical protein